MPEMISAPVPPPPLPARNLRSRRGGLVLKHVRVGVKVVTPILGGAPETRTVDGVDGIRVPTIRGHLRFWWRALHGHEHREASGLFAAERALWGGMSGQVDDGGRSLVDVRVTNVKLAAVSSDDVRPYPSQGQPATPGAYALWPARATNEEPTAPRRVQGTEFDLELLFPEEYAQAVRSAVLAWTLFGGYGSRTRRGVGSLRCLSDGWLPTSATVDALKDLFGCDVLHDGEFSLRDIPLLAGARLAVGNPVGAAETAWTTALSWLSEFRQGQPPLTAPAGSEANYARVRGAGNRPGRSNWPEADKVRRLSGTGFPHQPRHNAVPVYPRAGFGLPIVAQFQSKDRQGVRYWPQEPANYEIRWRDTSGERDRLASPLIVKSMAVAGGQFAPIALWLNRGYPSGNVVLRESDARAPGSAAEFDVLVAQEDEAKFAPLAGAAGAPAGTRLRTAFLSWLAGRGVTVLR